MDVPDTYVEIVEGLEDVLDRYYYLAPLGVLVPPYGRFLPKHFSDDNQVYDPLGLLPMYQELHLNTTDCSPEELAYREWLQKFTATDFDMNYVLL